MLDEDHYSCKCGYEISVLDVLNNLVEIESHYVPSTEEVICGECGSKYEKPIQIEKLKCPKCSGLMEEIRVEDESVSVDSSDISGGTLQIMGSPYKRSIHSDALGIQSDQVAEHREKFPYIELDAQNRPVFTNRADHDKYMEECGIVKQPSLNKKRGTIFSISGTSCHRGRDLRN